MKPLPQLAISEGVVSRLTVSALRTNKILKKALLLQGLFLCLALSAQTLTLQKPLPGQPLDDIQEFVIAVDGPAPQRVELYLNDRLLKARRKPPFRFEIRWNTRLQNRIRIIARYPSGKTIDLERVFREIKTDFSDELVAFQCFPFLSKPPSGDVVLESNGRTIKLQTFEPANKFTLDLLIVLDISGSMKHVLPEVSAGFSTFVEACAARNYKTRLILFDQEPRLADLTRLPADLADLYRGRGESVVWDSLATALGLFSGSPRRLVLLISDGADDGSRHDHASVETLLFQTGAPLVWLNPTTHAERLLGRAAEKSGGFSFFGDGGDPWSILLKRLSLQYHLLAPDAGWPIRLETGGGQTFYPRWDVE